MMTADTALHLSTAVSVATLVLVTAVKHYPSHILVISNVPSNYITMVIFFYAFVFQVCFGTKPASSLCVCIFLFILLTPAHFEMGIEMYTCLHAIHFKNVSTMIGSIIAGKFPVSSH